jgi:hypothetical protein
MIMVRTFGNIVENKEILAIPKQFNGDVFMASSGDDSLFLGAPVFNKTTGESIVGLGINFRAKRTPAYAKYNFGLTLREGGDLHILLDLCIYPNHMKSHMDRQKKERFFGSHIHILGENKQLNIDYNMHNWLDCFSIFMLHANIEFTSTRIVEPFAGDLI